MIIKRLLLFLLCLSVYDFTNSQDNNIPRQESCSQLTSGTTDNQEICLFNSEKKGAKKYDGLALIIANGNYQKGANETDTTKLTNLEHHEQRAKDLREKLRVKGFDVYYGTDLDYKQTIGFIQAFKKSADDFDYHKYFIFYTGHGFSFEDEEWIVPLDMPDVIQNMLNLFETRSDDKSISKRNKWIKKRRKEELALLNISSLIAHLENKKIDPTVLLYDACRDFSYQEKLRVFFPDLSSNSVDKNRKSNSLRVYTTGLGDQATKNNSTTLIQGFIDELNKGGTIKQVLDRAESGLPANRKFYISDRKFQDLNFGKQAPKYPLHFSVPFEISYVGSLEDSGSRGILTSGLDIHIPINLEDREKDAQKPKKSSRISFIAGLGLPTYKVTTVNTFTTLQNEISSIETSYESLWNIHGGFRIGLGNFLLKDKWDFYAQGVVGYIPLKPTPDFLVEESFNEEFAPFENIYYGLEFGWSIRLNDLISLEPKLTFALIPVKNQNFTFNYFGQGDLSVESQNYWAVGAGFNIKFSIPKYNY